MPIDLSGFDAKWTFGASSGLSAAGIARDGGNPLANVSPVPSGQNFAHIRAAGYFEQVFTVTVAGVHRVSFSAQRRQFQLSATETIRVTIDGANPYDPGTLTPYAWTAKSFTTTSLPLGDHVLRFAGQLTGQDEGMLIDSVAITDPNNAPVTLLNGNFDGYTALAPGGIVYAPPAVATPSYRLVATVSTCGKLIEGRLTNLSDGSIVAPGTVNQAPVVGVNGVVAGALQVPLGTLGFPSLWTPTHSTFLAPLPAGITVSRSDAVTLDADAGWIFGPSGYAEAMVAQVATNRVGRSFVRTVDVPRTMALGASYAHHVTAEWHPGFLPKNQRYRCAFWQPPLASQDGGGKPLRLGGPSATAPVVAVTASSNIDATGCPTPAGYWAVRYDKLGNSTASLTNGGDSNTSCVPVTSIANPGVNGVGTVKVFNFQPTGPAVNLNVSLRIDSGNADNSVDLDNLAILAPGDFAWAANTPTVIPMPAWSDVAACVEAKLPPSLPFGPHRLPTAGIELGESAACEREHVVEPGDFHWAQGVKVANQIRYIQARPWTNAASPYIYDPMAGTDYPASLTVPITTAPASGTVETITLAQVGDGLILTGLVLTIDAEKMRVMAPPTGPITALVTSVMRGVASTTPAQHLLSPPAVKTISVSARRPMANLSAFAPTNYQVTELVTQSPHRLKSGQRIPLQGNGWVSFVYTDGRGFGTTTPNDGGYHGFAPYKMIAYVTGESTFVVIVPGSNPPVPSVTLSTTYTLNPGPATPSNPYECSSLLYLPEYGGVPYEVAASAAAKHPGAPAWVTFCMVASDDMVDSIWRDRILPNLPADRDVWTEVGDEPWNFAGGPAGYWYGMSYQLYGSYNAYYWYGVRVAQIRDRGKAIWAAAGRDPARVKSSINVQDDPSLGTGIASILNFLASKSATPDAVAIAPYYNLYPSVPLWKCWAAWSTDMLVDAWIWDFYRNTYAGAEAHRTGDFKAGLDAWNAAHAGNVGLVIYEYAIDKPWPVYDGLLGADMDATTTTLVLAKGELSSSTPDCTGAAYSIFHDCPDDANKIQPGSWLFLNPEWVTVVSRSNATCIVNRGQGGTTAVPHTKIYIGSDGRPHPFPVTNDWREGTRDVVLHPNMRIAHYDALCFHQQNGISLMIPCSLDQEMSGGNAWPDYNGIAQQPGRGDGTDGKFNNLACLARRGQPNSKPLTVSQDANTVSPRGQAMIEFLTGVQQGGGSGRRPVFVRRTPARVAVGR